MYVFFREFDCFLNTNKFSEERGLGFIKEIIENLKDLSEAFKPNHQVAHFCLIFWLRFIVVHRSIVDLYHLENPV